MVTTLRTRPTEAQLRTFRDRVRAFIAEHAPPIEAREGHRAPVDAAQEALLRSWFASLFEAGFSVLIGRSNTAAEPTTTRCMTGS